MHFAQCERDRLAARGAGFECRDAYIDQFRRDVAASGEEDAANEGRGDGRGAKVGAAFEAVARVGVEPVAARGAAHSHGLEPGGLDEHVGGGGSNHRVPPAHDACKAERLHVVGDDKVFRVESALDAVEGLELFTFARAANDDAALDLVEVESVRGLTHGEPYKVGGVDSVGNLLLLEKLEISVNLRAGKPVTRIGNGDAAKDAS